MTDELKSAFDAIRAEDSLKAETTRFLYDRIQKRGDKLKRRVAFRKYAAAFACAVALFLSGSYAYSVYITPAAYVDVDINPSIELTLNRFDRVIGEHAYNDDGAAIIADISIKNKKYEDALIVLMDAIDEQGYIKNGELVSVTLQTDDNSRESEMLIDIQTGIEDYMTGHHHEVELDVFPVGGDVRNDSYEQGVSPAKYLAIQELIEVDPTASVENCHGHSISEIRRLTKEHGNHGGGNESAAGDTAAGNNGHHYEGGGQGQSTTGHDSEKKDNASGEGAEKHSGAQSNAHHGGGNKGNHRGGKGHG